MDEIAGIIVPFFGVILLGWGAGRLRFVRPDGLSAMNFFVFYLAMPALFFQLVAATPLDAFQGFGFILTTTFATYCVFAIAFSVGALLNGGNVSEATVEGLVGSYSNASYMGAAVAIAAFGTAAAMPAALVLTFDTVLILIVVPLMMAMGGAGRADATALAEDIGRQIFLHPLILATIAGFLFSALGIRLPGSVDGLLTGLRFAAVPCALFLLGVGLSARELERIPLEMPILVAIKLVVHPIVVFLLLTWVGGFDPVWIATAVIIAALPPAAQVHTLAKHYGVYAHRASGALALGMIVSISSLTLVLIVLFNTFPGLAT